MILHRHLPETKYNPKPENVEVKLSCKLINSNIYIDNLR